MVTVGDIASAAWEYHEQGQSFGLGFRLGLGFCLGLGFGLWDAPAEKGISEDLCPLWEQTLKLLHGRQITSNTARKVLPAQVLKHTS